MTASTRPKIWEIGEFQCPILGTCLSIAELRKLGRKARLAAAVNLSDFELYTVFVRKCQEKDSISIMVNKFLDRKYAKVIKNLARLKTPEDLQAAWQAAVADGDIPGAFWAIISHPEADKGLIHSIYGEVHMLSHLVGASNRADIRRLCGKCVLYVGGRSNLTPHYRKVVESLGCRFRHHDGGTECRLAMLEAELGKADVVICPVDCVSHEACQRVKRFCKSAAKPFVMLRSSGVSALSRSIQNLEIEGHEVACQT